MTELLKVRWVLRAPTAKLAYFLTSTDLLWITGGTPRTLRIYVSAGRRWPVTKWHVLLMWLLKNLLYTRSRYHDFDRRPDSCFARSMSGWVSDSGQSAGRCDATSGGTRHRSLGITSVLLGLSCRRPAIPDVRFSPS